MRIWCLGSKIGLVTGCSKSCFQLFLTQSGGTSLKREGKRRPRLIFFCCCFFQKGAYSHTPAHTGTAQRHIEAPVTSLHHISPEQPSTALPALTGLAPTHSKNEGTSKSSAFFPCLAVYICFSVSFSQVQLPGEQGPCPGIGLWGNTRCPTCLCLLIRRKCVCGTADAALEGKAYAWHASAVITRFMWDGRNSMLGNCNSNKTQRWYWFYYTANACI